MKFPSWWSPVTQTRKKANLGLRVEIHPQHKTRPISTKKSSPSKSAVQQSTAKKGRSLSEGGADRYDDEEYGVEDQQIDFGGAQHNQDPR